MYGAVPYRQHPTSSYLRSIRGGALVERGHRSARPSLSYSTLSIHTYSFDIGGFEVWETYAYTKSFGE